MVPPEHVGRTIIVFQYTQNKKQFIIAERMIRRIDIRFSYHGMVAMEIINQLSAVDRVQS